MFELSADDGADADVFGQSFYTGTQGAHAAHNQVDLHACRAGLVQRINHARFDKRIHLGSNPCRLACFGVCGFLPDAVDDHFVQGKGALIELVQTAGFTQTCDFHKQSVYVGGNLVVVGNDAEVGVDARCALVVVAGTEVGITFEHAVLAADYQCHFGMNFVAEYAVNDVCTCIFKLLRPVDVVGLIKTRHQFDHDGNLFACQRGLHQGAYEFGIAAGAVDGHFDGKDGGVCSGFAYHVDDGVEGLVRMVQKDGCAAYQFEYRAVFTQGFQPALCMGRKF